MIGKEMCLKFLQINHTCILPVFLIFLLSFSNLYGKSDTLVFDNGNMLVGEIKSMQKGVLEIDAPYGKSNFKIEWLSIKEIYTESKFFIYVETDIYFARLATLPDQKVKIFEGDSIFKTCELDKIVYLAPINDKFKDRLDVSIEVGLDLTRAQNLRQFSTRFSLSYRSEKSSISTLFNSLRSSQENTQLILRNNGEFNYRHIFINQWYIVATFAGLSNTEQRIDIRTNTQLGLGNYIYSSNKAYWGLNFGMNSNFERFESETSGNNNWESYLGTELNLFDVGDINLLFTFKGYTSLPDFNRFRSDINLDFKYDFPHDIFLRLGLSLNYDSQPAIGASEVDYVLGTGIGWSW